MIALQAYGKTEIHPEIEAEFFLLTQPAAELFAHRFAIEFEAVAVGKEGTIYAGGQGDFGFLRPDQAGAMKFVSLLDKVPAEDRKFADVWRILPTPGGVYFSTYARLFRANQDGSIKVWRPASNFGRAFFVLDALYVKTKEQGLLRMEDDKLSPIAGGAPFAKIPVQDAVSVGGDALIAAPDGLFRL